MNVTMIITSLRDGEKPLNMLCDQIILSSKDNQLFEVNDGGVAGLVLFAFDDNKIVVKCLHTGNNVVVNAEKKHINNILENSPVMAVVVYGKILLIRLKDALKFDGNCLFTVLDEDELNNGMMYLIRQLIEMKEINKDMKSLIKRLFGYIYYD